MDVKLLLALLAVILAGLAAFGVAMPRVHFGWASVALAWVVLMLL